MLMKKYACTFKVHMQKVHAQCLSGVLASNYVSKSTAVNLTT